MLTKEHISFQLQKYKAEHRLSLETMARRLDLPRSSLQEYLKGQGNPRSDMIDLIVGKIGITLPEMFADTGSDLERERLLIRTAQALGGLPPDRREEGVQLLTELANLFSA